MKNLILFSSKDRDNLVNARKGESKFGEHIQLLPHSTSIYDSLKDLDVDYVIFGIKEDVGIVANHGLVGASRAWDVVVKFLLNSQSNRFTGAKKTCVLGHLDFSEMTQALTQIKSAKKQTLRARLLVESIDKDVTFLVSTIIKAGKTPIVIGGGHNNSYGCIKGTALALNNKISAVNLDAHSDFRPEEGRHSGNGFSYAYAEGFLKNYFIFGLHENYTSENLLKTINKLKGVKYKTYEELMVRETTTFRDALIEAKMHMGNKFYGIEIDCDAIANIPSSAMTPSGFTVLQARQFVSELASSEKAAYLHICEAAPKKKTESMVGKLVSYLVTDFMKAHRSET